MEEYGLVLERGFSKLGRLQRQMTVQYRLEWSGREARFAMSRACEGNVHTESEAVQGMERDTAELLVRYLYENAVPLENWTDVLRELAVRA